jgi:glutamine amidotransferase
MCELFGYSSRKEKDLKPYLKEFFRHSVRHPNGWGLATFDGGVKVHTETVSAVKSERLPALLEELPDCKVLLAHIRRATIGGVKPENCHPFVRTDFAGRTWTLMHNGTVFDDSKLFPYQKVQIGDTDSERILLYLIDKMNEKIARSTTPLNSFERFRVVERVVDDLSYRNKLNLIIYDGSKCYVHVNMRDTLYVRKDEDGAMFATTPLEPQGWEPLPLNSVLVYEEGTLKYRGRDHHNEYLDVMGRVTLDYTL